MIFFLIFNNTTKNVTTNVIAAIAILLLAANLLDFVQTLQEELVKAGV